jgi:xanthine dehydrogenase YagS FAD-binding subunit
MQGFEYVSAESTSDAVQLLADAGGQSAVLAGGTDLLSLMKNYVVSPKRVVNIKSISQLQGIRYGGQGLRLGALATLDDVLANDKVREEYPSLAQAAEGVTSPQIRSMGTVGGDLCQRPRCWYYRGGHGLLAMHNNKSMVLEGDNRYHAILGNSGPAYFVSPSSLAPALMALGATVKVQGSNGSRDVQLQSFYQIPSSESEREYRLEDTDIITEIMVPAASRLKNATYEVRQKQNLDWPLATASVALQMDGSSVQKASVVLGHVAPIPWRSSDAERALVGKTISESTADSAGQAAVAQARALSGNRYKIQLARVAVKRAILRAVGREV